MMSSIGGQSTLLSESIVYWDQKRVAECKKATSDPLWDRTLFRDLRRDVASSSASFNCCLFLAVTGHALLVLLVLMATTAIWPNIYGRLGFLR